MTRYILTLLIAALGLAYYMCLLPSLHLMPDSLLLAILPTVGLHITLQRLDVTKAYHICVLIISAIFSAFYRLLDSDTLILCWLIILHAQALAATCCTLPVRQIKGETPGSTTSARQYIGRNDR